jgi:hypothetical protein
MATSPTMVSGARIAAVLYSRMHRASRLIIGLLLSVAVGFLELAVHDLLHENVELFECFPDGDSF